MLLFLIKKTFFDMWDNILRIFVINFVFILLLALSFSLLLLFKFSFPLFISSLILIVFMISIFIGGASTFIMDISDYKKPGFFDFFPYIKKSLKASIIFSIIIILYILVIVVAFYYYFSIKNIIGTIAGSLLFWITIIFILSIQFFFPILSRFGNNPLKVFRKCIQVFFDNVGFSIFIFLGIIIISIVSCLLGFLIPGIGTILLWLNGGFKLRLYKYDYLEKYPETKRNKIPWKRLIIKDVDMIGKRTLKGMIFPWKE